MTSVDEIIGEVMAAPSARGRRPKQVHAVILRQLDESDILRLHQVKDGDLGSEPRPLQKLRHSHHGLARLVASGTRLEECSLVTGYDAGYISNLQKDPAFQNLVGYYKEQVDQKFLDVHERIKSIGLDFLQELHDRLLADGVKFTNRELMEAIQLTLDRSGFGPTSNVKHSGGIALVTTEQLDRIKAEVARNQVGSIKQITDADSARVPLGTIIEHDPSQRAERIEGRSGERPDLPAEGGERAEEKVRG